MSYATQLAAISRKPSTIITITVDKCTRTFGTSPCLATGSPCYNTFTTCKYLSAYVAGTVDLKFCRNDTETPVPGQIIRPYLTDERYTPQEISPQEGLTINQRADLTFLDEPDNDIGIDPYRVSAGLRSAPGGSIASATQGDFWKKFKARNPNYKNRRVTIKKGFIEPGATEADYTTTFVGVMDNLMLTNTQAKITVKGLLQLTVVDYPATTGGTLGIALTTSSSTVVLVGNTGVVNNGASVSSQYFASGSLKIDTEIINYSSLAVDPNTGITTFSGITRGNETANGWSAAANHNASAAVQQAIVVTGNPVDIMRNLLVFAGLVDGVDIDTALFNSERDTWLNGIVFYAVIDTPTKIRDLLLELRSQTNTSLWQGDDQKIKIKYLGPNVVGASPYRIINDTDNIIGNTLQIDDNEVQRITRASIYYDILAGKSQGDELSYAKATGVINAVAESANMYNDKKTKGKMLSRWLRTAYGGDDLSRLICSAIVLRFGDGLRMVTFDLEIKDSSLAMGEVFYLTAREILDKDGANLKSLYQVVSKELIGLSRVRYKAALSNLSTKPAFIAPDTVSPNYDTASNDDKLYAYFVDETALAFPDGTGPYEII